MQCNHWTLVGVFLISFVNLLFELLLVRLASVTLAPQSAFVVISIVMCGMTIGALMVFLIPSMFRMESTKPWLSLSALLFALTEVAAVWIHLHSQFKPATVESSLLPFGLTYACMSLPFIVSGICVCLALSRFPNSVGKTYAVDLCGAASACLALPLILRVFDGVSACVFVASLGALSGLAFAIGGSRRLIAGNLIAMIFFCGLSLFNIQSHLIKIEWSGGRKEPPIEFESWNSYSRLTFLRQSSVPPCFWSLSSSAPKFSTVNQVIIVIDAIAATAMPSFDGDLEKLAYLKFDLVNVGHYLKDRSKVLVIGVGGGRDVLTALVFGAREVTGVEINDTIVDVLRGRYSSFNQVARDARFHLVNEDARTFLIRTKEQYDFIHLSLVDTFAATASGALTFTENSIYTVEAWQLVVQRLTKDGIFSVSYWYPEPTAIVFHRMVYMAAAALHAENIDNPRKHLIVLANKYSNGRVATILICRSPFSEKDLAKIREVAHTLNYEIVFDPEQVNPSVDAELLSNLNPLSEPLHTTFRFTPPTDDCPFVFAYGHFPWNSLLSHPEGIPLVVSFGFAVCGILLPLAFTKREFSLFRTIPLIVYFTMIGFGFISFEMSQMQKLSIFLGHPTLSLTVVLGTLLFSSGLGSFLIQTIGLAKLARNAKVVLAAIVLGLLLYQTIGSIMIEISSSSGIIVKVFTAIAIISPIGILMGMALPLGMNQVAVGQGQMIAWMWGINGAASVMGSVMAVLIAMHLGISFVFNLAIICYAAALASSMAWRKPWAAGFN